MTIEEIEDLVQEEGVAVEALVIVHHQGNRTLAKTVPIETKGHNTDDEEEEEEVVQGEEGEIMKAIRVTQDQEVQEKKAPGNPRKGHHGGVGTLQKQPVLLLILSQISIKSC